MTLAEVLVALVLLSLVLLAMGAASLTGFASVQRGNGQLAANQLANEVIEALRAERWLTVTCALPNAANSAVAWTGPPPCAVPAGPSPTPVDPYKVNQRRGSFRYDPSILISWVDSPCNGAGAPNEVKDYIKFDVTVSWRIKGGVVKTVNVVSFRTPNGDEKTPSPVLSPPETPC